MIRWKVRAANCVGLTEQPTIITTTSTTPAFIINTSLYNLHQIEEQHYQDFRHHHHHYSHKPQYYHTCSKASLKFSKATEAETASSSIPAYYTLHRSDQELEVCHDDNLTRINFNWQVGYIWKDFLEICMNIISMKMFLFFIYLPIFVISCAMTYFVELNTTP